MLRVNSASISTGGACIQFSYNTFGESWQGAQLSLLLKANGSGDSQVLWEHAATDQEFWQTTRITVRPQQLLFQDAKITLVSTGGGQLSDLGFDDLQVAVGNCDVQPHNICSKGGKPIFTQHKVGLMDVVARTCIHACACVCQLNGHRY